MYVKPCREQFIFSGTPDNRQPTDDGADIGGNGAESGLKSRVKVFTQTIIGMYLCPGSRAETAEKETGRKKGLKVALRFSRKLWVVPAPRKSC
jgi:hypothetical protein